MNGLSFDPLLPWPVVAGFAVLAALVAGWSLWRGLRGWAWRGLAGLAAALALAGPGARLIGPRVVSGDGLATAAIAEGGGLCRSISSGRGRGRPIC